MHKIIFLTQIEVTRIFPILTRQKPYLYLIFSGMLCGCAFTFSQLSLLMWVALVPFFIGLHHLPHGKSHFRAGFTFGGVYYGLLLSWMWVLYPLDWLGASGWQGLVLMAIIWLAMSAYEALGIGIITALWQRLKFNKTLDVLTLSFLWVLLEFVQGLSFMGFTWGRLGISQYPTPLLIQSASLFGSLFISFLLVLVNGLFANLLIYPKRGKLWGKWALSLAGIFTFLLGFGYLSLNETLEPTGTVKATIVQGNISSNDKWATGSLDDIVATYLDLSQQALADQPELLLWPETAVPIDLADSPDITQKYQALAQKGACYFLFGGFENGDGHRYNAITAMNPQGEVMPNSYYKQHLVPFGEYVPYKNLVMTLLPMLAEVNRLDSDISPGDGAKVLSLPFGQVGSLICFESIFPHLARSSVQEGADMLFIATNDSWYQSSAAIIQHNGQAIFRAVENHRTIIRAANTGLSSFIDPKGRIISSIAELDAAYLTETVAFYNNQTLYNRFGDLIVLLAFFYCVGLFVHKKIKH